MELAEPGLEPESTLVLERTLGLGCGESLLADSCLQSWLSKVYCISSDGPRDGGGGGLGRGGERESILRILEGEKGPKVRGRRLESNWESVVNDQSILST